MLQDTINKATTHISKALDLKALEEIRLEFLGKNSAISLESRKMSSLDEAGKKELGRQLNEAKNLITEAFDAKHKELKSAERALQLESEKLDLSLPPRPLQKGSIHPISQAMAELLEIFVRLGCEVKEGNSIEDDWHNFTALNFPEHHPARQMHDTFYLNCHSREGGNPGQTNSPQGDNSNDDIKLDPRLRGDDSMGPMLLRTHTSTVQIRSMMNGKPPFRFVAPGRTYRSDSDMTHTPMFHQIEALVIDKDLHMGHLKHFITEFIHQFFERDDMEVRLRPSFFPFTEPSAEVDISMNKGGKWLEVLGCGMVHPNVLRNCNIDPEEYQGFALGMGVERLAMLKYGIEDLRQFFEGDKRWLDHYSFSAFDLPSFAGGLTR